MPDEFLVTCPYCLGPWLGAGLMTLRAARPGEARFLASVFAAPERRPLRAAALARGQLSHCAAAETTDRRFWRSRICRRPCSVREMFFARTLADVDESASPQATAGAAS